MKTRFALVVAAAMLLACQSSVDSSNAVVGYWSNDDVHLSATSTAAVLDMPCQQAGFAALVVDSTGNFSAESSSFTESGNVNQQPGDKLHIGGHLTADTLFLTVYVIHPSPPVSDPLAFRLVAGGSHTTPVCTA